MIIELNDQQAKFLQEYLKYEIENEQISNFAKKIMVDLLEQLAQR